jgi:hypothetical protein
MIFFAHVQRTGGSSVHSYFFQYFRCPGRLRSGSFHSKCRSLIASGIGDLPAASNAIAALPDRDFYFGGHIGLHDLQSFNIQLKSEDIVFSLVRDPVERAISLFFLMQRSPDWFPTIYPHVESRDFAYFYEFNRDAGHYFRDDHCRLISGRPSFKDAVKHIEQRFAIVGATSSMNEFERALVRTCAPLLTGFQIRPRRENAAWHRQTGANEWAAKASVKDVAAPRLIEKIRRENENDMRLKHFVEGVHGGLFMNQRLAHSSAIIRAPQPCSR